MSQEKLWVHLFVFIVIGQLCLIDCVSFDEDTRITASQAGIIEKLRDRVSAKVPHKYMQDSISLVRWLRAKNYNLRMAEDMLLKHIQWRRDNRIDTIDKEDWTDFQTEFPWYLNGTDKEGRPLVQVPFGDWDMRKAVVTGRRGRLVRWVYKYFEDATKRVRELQKDGKNVTQFTLLLDADGFNIVNHGCSQCMSIYLALSDAYEAHYPGSIDRIHVTNTPEFFHVVLRLVWGILSEETRNALKVHGTDRKAWRKILSDSIDDSQLISNFGGTMNVGS